MDRHIYSFLGLPASGKGTQAEILAQKLNIEKIIGVGGLVRQIINEGNPDDSFVASVKDRYEKGIPQPDEVAVKLASDYLDSHQEDIIFDNFPLSKGQAKFLIEYLANDLNNLKIIYIKVDPEKAIKRALSRKICGKCSAIYASTELELCEKCGGKLISRTDDTVEIMRERMSYNIPVIEEVLSFYRENNIDIIEINGNEPVEKVTVEIDMRI
ncbi:MAG: nucleoside monophosphate kinase [Patescibacteria group bacterium]